MNQLLTKTTAGSVVASTGVLVVTAAPDLATKIVGAVLVIAGLLFMGYSARDNDVSDQEAKARIPDPTTGKMVNASDVAAK